jgi:nucleotide-binding universal stress UspA family protein
MDVQPQLLLCTHGGEETRPALDYGVDLAGVLGWPVLVLGVDEKSGQENAVGELVEAAENRLKALGLQYQTERVHGSVEDAIAVRARSGAYLTVLGRLGRPVWQQVISGRSFRRVLSEMTTPLLYVPARRWPVRRMLVCSGGLGYASSLAHLSIYLARACGASAALLHVVEPGGLNYPLAHQVEEHWDKLLETDTPQGHNLKRIFQEMEQAGLEVEVRIRRGMVVHEILEEIKRGDYDLVGMGSPHSTHSLRHYYLPNVTAEVAETADVPILAVRYGFEFSSDSNQ